MTIFKDKRTRAVIYWMIALVILGLTANWIVRTYQNNSVDPRIVTPRLQYQKYNSLAQGDDVNALLALLDSVEMAYQAIPHYENSYEVGVLYNNRAALYLTYAIYKDSIVETVGNNTLLALSKDSLLQLANTNISKGIAIYKNWMVNFGDKTEAELTEMIRADFFIDLEATENMAERYLANRVKEFQAAQYETERRLSVSLTNQGIIYRHQNNYEAAIKNYQEALKLWDRNLEALNAMNVLLDKPQEKRNMIQKMFPPSKKED